MFFLALILDLMGLACLALDFLGIGLGISFLPDLLGFIFLGGWIYFVRGNSLGFGGSFKGFSISSIIELVPGLGDLSPTWTILVITEMLKD